MVCFHGGLHVDGQLHFVPEPVKFFLFSGLPDALRLDRHLGMPFATETKAQITDVTGDIVKHASTSRIRSVIPTPNTHSCVLSLNFLPNLHLIVLLISVVE